MLSVPSSVRILIAIEPTDMRKGVDGLCRIAEAEMGGDVYAGTVFVFVSKRRDRLKILTWDTGGFVIFYNYLSSHYTSS